MDILTKNGLGPDDLKPNGTLGELRESVEALPDAVAELSEMVSDNTIDTADIMDAIAELSEIVSQIVEGA